MLTWVLASVALATTPPPPRLTLTMEALVPGNAVQIRVEGAPPSLPVTLLRSLGGPGPGPCRPTAGVCLDVLPAIQVVASRNADAWGRAVFNATVPALPPDDAWWQAVAFGPGVAFKSDVVYLPVSSPCVDDAAEDDDDAAHATVGGGTFSRTACPGDPDAWAVSIAPGNFVEVSVSSDAQHHGAVRAELSMASGGSAAATSLYDGQGTTMLANTGPVTSTARVTATVADDVGEGGVPYTLQILSGSRPVCGGYNQEPDDTRNDATLVASGGTLTGHVCANDDDYIAIDAQAGDALMVDVAYDGAWGDCVQIQLQDAAGTALDTSDGTCGVRASKVAPTTGRYYARVRFVADDARAGGVPYTATATATPRTPCPVDSFEPNDVGAAATPVTTGVYTGLGACTADTYDWYRVDLLPWERVDVSIPFASTDDGDGTVVLRLVDSVVDNADLDDHLVFNELYNTGSRQRVHTSTTGGTVYIVVSVLGDTNAWRGSYLTSGGNTYDLVVDVR